MLHFFWTPHAFRKHTYEIYETAHEETIKYAQRFFETVTTVHITNFRTGRVTDRRHDILLGCPTWDPQYTVTSDWVRDNALDANDTHHPNTFVMIPWVPTFPPEWHYPYLETQLESARTIFAMCGEYWYQKSIALDDGSLQARVKDKLVQINMGCAAERLPYKNSPRRSKKPKLLHVSNLGSYKRFPLLLQSVQGIGAELNVASRTLRAKGIVSADLGDGTSVNFNSLGAVNNNDPEFNRFAIDEVDFYIHTSDMDAQATVILENCARGLVPLVTPESGLTCDYAVYLTDDPQQNQAIIANALEMPQAEYAERSYGVREQILREHSWDAVYARVWSSIQHTLDTGANAPYPLPPDTRPLKLNGNDWILAPNSIAYMTSYVLEEQGDWFEDEIAFVRRAINDGDVVLDVGASFGTFSLACSKAVGDNGHVWVFEPTPATAQSLEATMCLNGRQNVTVVRKAVSETSGHTSFSVRGNSELNSIGLGDGERHIEVEVTSLDDFAHQAALGSVDFIKLDVEGQEAQVLRGANSLLAARSPLIQYEIKAGNYTNLALTEAFEKLGYHSYALVPGLGVLVPADVNENSDPFLLNLFACKVDRASKLGQAGYLLIEADFAEEISSLTDEELVTASQSLLTKLPYAAALGAHWGSNKEDKPISQLTRALGLYAVSCDEGLSSLARYQSLKSSYECLKGLCASKPTALRQMTFARVARDFGRRGDAVAALQTLAQAIQSLADIDLTEPFLVPQASFEKMDPGEQPKRWVYASLLDGLEHWAAFSSYFTGTDCLPRLEKIESLGFATDATQKRRNLVRRRFKLP